MRKKIYSMLLTTITIISIFVCGNLLWRGAKAIYQVQKLQTSKQETQKQDNNNTERFKMLNDKYTINTYAYRVIYDTKTNIVYLSQLTSNYNTSLEVLYNKDGKPMTLDEYNSTK